MDIAFIHPNSPEADGTGATHSATQIVDVLRDQGHNLTVYCTDGKDRTATQNRLQYRLLETDGWHTNTTLNQTIKARTDEFEKYDIIHSYLMESIPAINHLGEQTLAATAVTLNAYGGICPKNDVRFLDREPCSSNGLLKCAACSMITSPGHDDFSAPHRAISRLGNLRLIRGNSNNKHIDGYQALSPHVKSTYTTFGFTKNRITVIPNIAEERFITLQDRQFSEPISLLYIGSLERHKGVYYLIPMFSELQKLIDKEIKLTIVGSGGEKSTLKSQISKYELDEHITLAGRVPHNKLVDVYNENDLFVYPGQWDEPFGRVFLEALGTGMPVVASDVGSIKDIIGSGGITTAPNASALAQGVADVITNERLEQMSYAAKQKVTEYYPDTVAKEFEEFYEQL